ncbi:MAG: Gp15 family bacteriophage protein, partial [Acetanaerobacterium sp.]
GRRIKLNLAYDVVLRVYELQRDEWFDGTGKMDLSLRMLVINYGKVRRISYAEKAELLQQIFEQHIIVKSKQTGNYQKVVDFEQDARYIYASFLMDYGIDLVDQRGKLDWRKFFALFQGLSDKTKIREVMSIRTKTIPTPSKYNAEEIKLLREAKAYYALKVSAEDTEEQFQQGLNRLANTLEQRAKGR